MQYTQNEAAALSHTAETAAAPKKSKKGAIIAAVIAAVVLAALAAGAAIGIYEYRKPINIGEVLSATAEAFGENYAVFRDGFASLRGEGTAHTSAVLHLSGGESELAEDLDLSLDLWEQENDGLISLRAFPNKNEAGVSFGARGKDILFTADFPGTDDKRVQGAYTLHREGAADAFAASPFNPAVNEESPLPPELYDSLHSLVEYWEKSLAEQEDKKAAESEQDRQMREAMEVLSRKIAEEADLQTFSVRRDKEFCTSFTDRLVPERHLAMELQGEGWGRILACIRELAEEERYAAFGEAMRGSIPAMLAGMLAESEEPAGLPDDGEVSDVSSPDPSEINELSDPAPEEALTVMDLIEDLLGQAEKNGLHLTMEVRSFRGHLTGLMYRVVPETPVDNGMPNQIWVIASAEYDKNRMTDAEIALLLTPTLNDNSQVLRGEAVYHAEQTGEKRVSTLKLSGENPTVGSEGDVIDFPDGEMEIKLSYDDRKIELDAPDLHMVFSYDFTENKGAAVSFGAQLALLRYSQKDNVFTFGSGISDETKPKEYADVLRLKMSREDSIPFPDAPDDLFAADGKALTLFGGGEDGLVYAAVNYLAENLQTDPAEGFFTADGFLVQPETDVRAEVDRMTGLYVRALQQIMVSFRAIDEFSPNTWMRSETSGLTYLFFYDGLTDSAYTQVYANPPEELLSSFHPAALDGDTMVIHNYVYSALQQSCTVPSYQTITCRDCPFVATMTFGLEPELQHRYSSEIITVKEPLSGGETQMEVTYCTLCGGKRTASLPKAYSMTFETEDGAAILTGVQPENTKPYACLVIPGYADRAQTQPVRLLRYGISVGKPTVIYLSEGIDAVGYMALQADSTYPVAIVLPKSLKYLQERAFPDGIQLLYCGSEEDFAKIENSEWIRHSPSLYPVTYNWNPDTPLAGLFESSEQREARLVAVSDAYKATQNPSSGGSVSDNSYQKNIAAGAGIVKAVFDSKNGVLVLLRDDGVIRTVNPRTGKTYREVNAGAGSMDADNGYIVAGSSSRFNKNNTFTVYNSMTLEVVRTVHVTAAYDNAEGIEVAIDGDTVIYGISQWPSHIWFYRISDGSTVEMRFPGSEYLISYPTFAVDRTKHQVAAINRHASPRSPVIFNTVTGEYVTELWNAGVKGQAVFFDGKTFHTFDHADSYSMSGKKYDLALDSRFDETGVQKYKETELFTVLDFPNEMQVHRVLSRGLDGVEAAQLTSVLSDRVQVLTAVYLGNRRLTVEYYADHALWCGEELVFLWTEGSPNGCMLFTVQVS